jgi:hypothetical protein
MKDNEIQRLIDIRTYLISKYGRLDGRGNVGTAVMLQKDVAEIIEHTIKSIDSLLGDYVEIKKK